MILSPQNPLSLASLILACFFFQGAVFLFYFYFKVSRPLEGERREYLYFSLMSFCQALYSFCASELYSAPTLASGQPWVRMQWVAGVLIFVFFTFFSLHYLKLRFTVIRWTVGLPAFFFGLLALLEPSFLTQTPAIKIFHFWGREYKIYETALGDLAWLTGLWLLIHLLLILGGWYYFLRQQIQSQIPAIIGLTLLVLAAINELLVGLQIYSGPYVFEYGFLIFSVAIYLQLFTRFFKIYRMNLERAAELTQLHEESRFFINTVAHDLKAPLLSIEGFSNLLQEDVISFSSEKSRDYLKRISRNAKQMMHQLGELKRFINIGIISQEIEPIPLSELLGEVLKTFEIPLKPFEVTLQLAEMKPFRFSRHRLQDVFTNLIDNAIKFTQSQEHPRLTIEVKPETSGVLFKIEDNGCGIDSLHHEKIFDLFYRVHPGTMGSGIGLAAVKKIIDQAEGKIWVESELGQGTRVFFWIPSVS